MKAVFFTILFLCAAARSETVLTSANLKTLLDEKNSRVAAARLQASAAKERQGYFARSLFPNIGLFGAQESFKTGSRDTINQPYFGAEASVNLFNGGRDWNEAVVREKKADQKQLEAVRIEAEELEKLRVLYWQALYMRDKMELIKSDIKLNESNLNSAVRRIRSGVATDTDRIEFEMHAITVKQELEETRLKYEAAIRDLAALINIEDPAGIKLSEVLTHDHDYHALLKHTADDHDFLFKEQELQSDISSLEAKTNSYEWVPKVDAFATYYQYNQREIDVTDEAERRESVLGVKVSMNLGSVLEARREASALRQESEGLKRMAYQKKREIHVHIDNELAELDLLHSQVHLAEENIAMAEKYYRMTQSEYARGVKNSPDVLGASARLFENKNKQLEIVRDFQISKAHILSKIGK